MTEQVHDPKNGALPVSGYKPQTQTQEKVDIVNGFKADEERILRKLDALAAATRAGPNSSGPNPYDARWLAIGRTQLEQAFMAINRAVFQPDRVDMPEDEI
jgi:hypothetical protein